MNLSAAVRGQSERPARPLAERLLWVCAGWLVVYLVLQGTNGFFARTIDHVDALWLKLTVFNIPLHLGLTLVGAVGLRSGPVWLRRIGVGAVVLNVVLIVAHVMFSIVLSVPPLA